MTITLAELLWYLYLFGIIITYDRAMMNDRIMQIMNGVSPKLVYSWGNLGINVIASVFWLPMAIINTIGFLWLVVKQSFK